MKTFKTNISVIVMMGLCLGAAAQPDTLRVATLTHKAEAMTAGMERELNLTKDQKASVMKAMVNRLESIKNGNPLDLANSRARENLAAILTKEQYALYLNLREDTKKQKDEYIKNGGINGNEIDKELDL